MSYQQIVEQHHSLEYANNVEMVTQQMDHRLRMAVDEISCEGEAHAFADLIDPVEAKRRQGRDRTNPENPSPKRRRWLIPQDDVHTGEVIDREEKFLQHTDPTSDLVRNGVVAVKRIIDDIILGVEKQGNQFVVSGGGVMGRVSEGKRPGQTIALPSDVVIGANGTGMTTDKLIDTQEGLMADEFGIDEMDPLYCAIGPRQVSDLLRIADDASASLNAFQIEQLKTGTPTPLMGITWIVTNRLPKGNDNIRKCPVWAKSNIKLGIWQDVTGMMWNLSQQLNLPYAYVYAKMDCGRKEDKGVRIIECFEAPAA